MIEEGKGAKAMSPGWWFDRAEGIGVEVVVSCVHTQPDPQGGWPIELGKTYKSLSK